MTYKVIKKFGMFEYNPKTKGSKIVWREVGDSVDSTTFRRMSNPDRYVSRD